MKSVQVWLKTLWACSKMWYSNYPLFGVHISRIIWLVFLNQKLFEMQLIIRHWIIFSQIAGQLLFYFSLILLFCTFHFWYKISLTFLDSFIVSFKVLLVSWKSVPLWLKPTRPVDYKSDTFSKRFRSSVKARLTLSTHAKNMQVAGVFFVW